jgi:hypothetical protein
VILWAPSDGLTLEAYKRKVLEVLLTRDIAAFTTEELSLFLRVCPKKANNSKPVEHAERYGVHNRTIHSMHSRLCPGTKTHHLLRVVLSLLFSKGHCWLG